jgi:hypothetical protein
MSIDLSTLHLDWGSSRYKGKVYRSYSLARPLWVDGKNKKKPIVKLIVFSRHLMIFVLKLIMLTWMSQLQMPFGMSWVWIRFFTTMEKG